MPKGKVTIKVASGKFIKELRLTFTGKTIECQFGFNRPLMATIKAMEGARWHGYDDKNPRKIWSIADSQHNHFRLNYLQWLAQPLAYRKANPEKDPYWIYDQPLVKFETDRPLRSHQYEMVSLVLTRKCCEFAVVMGGGKTLAAIEAAEQAGMQDGEVWYVGPKAGTKAVPRELRKWNCNHSWRFFTYAGLVNFVKGLESPMPAPKFFIIDEASKVKSASAQRSQAVAYIADCVRAEHGSNGYVVEMSGTPAPKDPSDWWHQVRVIAPGFIAEGSREQFRRNLCLMEQRDSLGGGSYPHLITWWDDADKCKVCGEHSGVHTATDHHWEASEDRVSGIYKRLKGLVMVKFEEDCGELPPLQHEIIDIMPKPETLRAAKLISKHSGRAVQTLNLLRQLSDGFQYVNTKVGEEVCPECDGAKVTDQHIPKTEVDTTDPNHELDAEDFTIESAPCPLCGGKGEIPKYARTTEVVSSPKDDFFIDDLDQHEDVGRYIVWGGFKGTVDRLVNIAHKQGWATLQVDGRGYIGTSATGKPLDGEEMLDAMDASFKNAKDLAIRYPRICFCGNPEAGGMALTLTASPTSLYFSNSFKGEARMQSRKRGHRLGMPGWTHTLKDLIHLPSDKLVLDNLTNKQKLMEQTMGMIKVSQDEILACFG